MSEEQDYPKMPLNAFRANAGVVVVDEAGLVLAFERSDYPGSWQFPQGGIDEGETAQEAAIRELTEETSVSADDVELIDEFPDWIVYEIPKPNDFHGRGQAQKWFMFRLTTSKSEVRAKPPEFVDHKWLKITELIPITAPFRKVVYERLASHFSDILA